MVDLEQTVNVSEQAVLVVPSIRLWTARKYDRSASQEVADHHGARSKAGRYNKLLITTDGPYKAVTAASGELRVWAYRSTLPWHTEGTRILPTRLLMEFSEGWRERFAVYEQAVSSFLQAYPSLQVGAARELGTLYRAEDYPSVESLKARFSANLTILPFPDARDLRAQVPAEQAETIKRQLEQHVREAVSNGTQDLYRRLLEAVGRMAERLAEPDKIFRDSLVSNLSDLCKIVPALNLEQDAQLETLRQDVETKLTQHAPSVLRENEAARSTVAKDAADIMARLESLYAPSLIVEAE